MTVAATSHHGRLWRRVRAYDPTLIPLTGSATEAAAEVGSLRRSIGQHRSQIERELEVLSAQFEEALTTLKSDQAEAHQAISEQQAAAR